jgi:ubiquinone/menaquinone biosynthesis C-methylase UbiE
MTAENLKFKHFFFDYIFLFNTYAHLNNVDKSFKEVFRVLRDGGAIFLRDSYDFPDSVRFIRNMHKNNHTATHVIEKLKENYFSIRYINENRECDKVYWRIVAMKNTFGYKINKKIEKDFKNRKI